MFKVAPFAATMRLVVVFVSAACEPLSLYFMQRLVDSVSLFAKHGSSLSQIIIWVVLLVMATMLLDNINFFSCVQIISLQRRLNKRLTGILLKKFRRIEYSNFENPSVQDTLERMGSEPQTRFFNLFQGGCDILSVIITAAGLALVIAQVSIFFAVALFFVFLLTLVLQFKSVNMWFKLFHGQTEEERRTRYLEKLMSDKRSLFDLHVFRSVGYIRELWSEKANLLLKERIKTSFSSQKYMILSNICVIAWMGAIAYLLVSSLFTAAITLGVFVSLLGSIKSISGTKVILGWAFWGISQNHLEMRYYNTFMDLSEVPSPKETIYEKKPHGKQYVSNCIDDQETGFEHPKDVPPKASINPPDMLTRTSCFIEFDHVSFTYPGTDKPVLEDLCFKVADRELIALVGRNGAGKSTITKLLSRLYHPSAGNIRVAGRLIDEIAQDVLAKTFSVVFQDFAKYQLTLRENVAFGAIEKLCDDIAIVGALQKARFDNTSLTLDSPLGRIEKDGVDLSGGQWQRLALSRAFLADNQFFVLDEPTASLDPVAESEMYSSFISAMAEHGCLVISHRLASAKLCERILVLDDGRIVEEGSHDELMSHDGLYREMFDKQSLWYVTSGKSAAGDVDEQ